VFASKGFQRIVMRRNQPISSSVWNIMQVPVLISTCHGA
jgi:hypothetical protein